MLRFSRNRLFRRGRRGQAIVLGALSVLILAVALFMTLGISWSAREKVRVQNAADAQAYSSAVKVARAFNYFAYSNRAMAGAMVSMTMLHAYHSEIIAGNDLFFVAFLAMMQMSGCEFGICCSVPWCGCCRISHCIHGVKDIADAMKALSSWGREARDIRSLENPFRNALDALKGMINMMRLSQMGVRMSLMLDLMQGTPDLKQYNIPAGSDSPGGMIGVFNFMQFNGALDTTTVGSRPSNKRRDVTEVVNSARPLWVRNRMMGVQSSIVLAPMADKVRQRIGGTWFITQPPLMGGAAALLDRKPPAFLTPILLWGKPNPNIQGKYFGSTDNWQLFGQKRCCAGGGALPFILSMVMPSVLATGQNDGDHKQTMIQNAHSGQHRLSGMDDLFNFTLFNISSSGRYNQPVIFGSARQNLSRNENGGRLPWDITSSGNVNADLTQRGSIQLANTRESVSMAKAVVYYHHPGNWREPPNFFNAFWHAKLHPFSAAEAMMIAGSLGSSAGAAAAMMGVGTASGGEAMSAF